ncbi:hypothetical protein [Halopiger xanaduensis]|uniref:Uncharacterized protein n=1 Tax=Halopiger xanaduensis (strain DSM 18323 / JCM 14033 / SH-6) TaxID=797210 RepID=F8D9R4_HALXS|nr:hypothetical protein [Halopiger xanaduensis]AEH37667.1 hypothetical protein Halxa_3052 [Halopiger xanaduensis SH-6]
MYRRALLTLVGGSLTAVAGCSDVADEQTTSPQSNDTPDDTPTGVQSEDPRIDVDLTTAQYRVHVDEVSHPTGINQRNILSAEDRHPDFETAIREARDDGEFQTADPSEGLLQSIDEFRRFGIGYRYLPYVELDGQEYKFAAAVPEYVYRLDINHSDAGDPDDIDVDPDRIAHFEDDVDSGIVEAFVDTLAALTPHSPRDSYRRSIVPEEVASFVETYDYLETPQMVAPIEADVEDPGAPYTIRVEKLTERDLRGQEIIDIDEFGPELRSFLETAIASPHRAETISTDQREYRTDEIPDLYWEYVTSSPRDVMDSYVRHEREVYEVRVEEPDRDHPINLTVTPVSDVERPTFEITISPDETVGEDDEVILQSHGLLPSVLWVGDGDERHRLETPVDDRIEWQEVDQDEVDIKDAEYAIPDRVIANRQRDTLVAGQSITRTYTLPESVSDGTYRGWASLEVGLNVPHDDMTAHPFGVTLEMDTE